ncbi:MAG: 1-acyl-sn-glycerol-3-phosphate acyltransferase [Polyangiaceae bacterium]
MSSDAPIFHFNDHRDELVREVVRRVTSRVKDPHAILSDAIYHEVKRLTASGGGPELSSWKSLARRLSTLSEQDRIYEVRKLAEEHAWDVAGNFDRRVYAVATRLLPPVLGALIAPKATMSSLQRLLDARELTDRISVEGDTDRIRRLAQIGTVVYVPTHLSNMDSIVFGYALERAGLPPATYGAGKNLFTNPVLSFFMHNLGAYRVDRRLRHLLYKDVLKTYSCAVIERGYHSLFFPGGTRSRSGGVERRLKLGLAGTGVEAFARTALKGPEHTRRVFFVPATIAYLVTLEAETLITDFLSEAGKSRFIIEDDESSRWAKVASFSEKLLRHDAGVAIRFGEPLDPFGNAVTDDGMSVDARGHIVDPITYIQDRHGQVTVDPSRDAQYTRELGDEICKRYLKHTVILATNVVAAVMLSRLRKSTDGDLFTLLRVRGYVGAPRHEIAAEAMAMRDKLLELERQGEVRVGTQLRMAQNGDEIVSEAVRAWGGAHSTEVVREEGSDLAIGSSPLVFYYQNRLAAHGLAYDVLAPKRGAA